MVSRVIKSDNFRTHFLVCLLLTLILLLPYSQVRNHDFVDLDDYDYIVENHYIKNGLTVDGLIWAFSFQHNDKSYWRPLTWISHMLDFEFFGNDAGWHHLTNLFLHLLNTLLLYALLFIMTEKLGRSALVAALFALHPINVESVAWVTERNNVLCTAAGLATLLFYVRYVSRPSLNRYLLVFLTFILCLMVKPILVTLPFLMLLLDFWPLDRFGYGLSEQQDRKKWLRRLIVEKVPLIILSFLAIWISVQRHGNPASLEQVSMQLRVSNAIVAYVQYMINLAYPVNLAALYPFPKIIPIWKTFGALSVLLGISGIAAIFVKKIPYLFVGWFWYAGTMFPKIGLVQVGLWPALADRWAYFPAVGLFIIISWTCIGYFERQIGLFRKLLILVTFTVFGVTAYLAWTQVGYWANSTKLFERMLDKTHDNFLAHNNYGRVLAKLGRYAEAKMHFLKAIDINPGFEIAYLNIGKIAYDEGDIEKTKEFYEKAIAIKPDYYSAHLFLGNLYLRTKYYQKSWHHYSEAIRVVPDEAVPYNGLGGVLVKIGNIEDARKMFQKALELDPEYEPAKINLTRVTAALQTKKHDSNSTAEPTTVE